MFNMEKIGRKIAQMRKQQDMTQMDLADRLNISFQAVSNWERGQSMPDIAKLGELSELLGTSIDELLENESSAKKIRAIQRDEPLIEPLAKEELEQLAPLMKPTQANRVAAFMKDSEDLSSLSPIFPFISDTLLTEIAWEHYRRGGLTGKMAVIAPHLPDEVMDALAVEAIKNGQKIADLSPFFPFISEETLRFCADAELEETGDLHSITGLAPFLEKDYLDEIAVKAVERQGINAITCIAPFVSDEVLNRLACEVLERDGLAALSPIMPFIDIDIIEPYIRQHKK